MVMLSCFGRTRRWRPEQLTWQPLGIQLSRDSSSGITWGIAVASASRTPRIGNYISAWRRDGARWSIAALVFAGLGQLPRPALAGGIPLCRKAIKGGGSLGPFVAADLAFARLARGGDLGWTVGEATITWKDADPS